MQALERLIGFLPVILLFLIPALLGLQRAKRRRRAAAAGGGRAEGVQAGPERGLTEYGEWEQEPPHREVAASEHPAVMPVAVTGSAPQELYAYPPPLQFTELRERGGGEVAQTRGAVYRPASQRRAQPARPTRGVASPERTHSGSSGSAAPGEALWQRLSALSPLQRGVVFSEILGPPRGLSEPERGAPGV